MFSIKITRRQFLKWLSASAASVGISQTELLKLQKAFASGPTPNPNMPLGTLARVVWITGQDCGGCATTLLNYLANPADEDPVLNAVATTPIPSWLTDIDALYPLGGDGDIDIGEVVLEIVSIEWAYIVMAASGDVANDYLLQVRDDGGYVLMMDGSIPTKWHGKACKIMDVNGWLPSGIWDTAPGGPYVDRYTDPDLGNRTEITMAGASLWLAENAVAVIAMGTCNSWGGIPASKGAKTGAKSAWEWLNGGPAFGGNSLGKVIANVPGCAPNPDWFIHTVAAFLVGALNLNTELDYKGRPKLTSTAIYHPDAGYVFCEDCPRRPSQPGPTTLLAAQKSAAHPDGQCLFNVGCMGRSNGPANNRADCPTRKWNPFEDHSKNNWCVGNNMPCQGCTDPGFPDTCSPFYDSHKNV
jgi:hydrogenase small subunit